MILYKKKKKKNLPLRTKGSVSVSLCITTVIPGLVHTRVASSHTVLKQGRLKFSAICKVKLKEHGLINNTKRRGSHREMAIQAAESVRPSPGGFCCGGADTGQGGWTPTI